jgi:polar amino acid transport system substrate-binding protein
MASLGILVSGVAHEINNPNHFILSNTTLIKDFIHDIEPILTAYQKEHGDFVSGGMKYSKFNEKLPSIISGIVKGSERIKQIVKELRDFAIPRSSELKDTVDINAVLRSSVVLVSNMVSKATRNFRIEYDQDIPLFRGNSQRLEQVVINLISNACQALDDSEQAISVYTKNNPSDGTIHLVVQDEGRGMSGEVLEHLADPFYTTRREQGGTGLGLSISTTIVKEHSGTLEFDSKSGKGTTAKIVLPVSPELDEQTGE